MNIAGLIQKKFVLIILILVLNNSFTYGDISNFPDSSKSFELQPEQLMNQFKLFSEEFSQAILINASMGLKWSTPYIGQLLDRPVHFGVDLSIGSAFFKPVETNDFTRMWGITPAPMLTTYQITPMYIIDARFGGFADLPVDVGIKAGFLPSIGLPLWGNAQDFSFLTYGVHLNWTIYHSDSGGPTLTLGAAFNHITAKSGSQAMNPQYAAFYAADVKGYDIRWVYSGFFFTDYDNPGAAIAMGAKGNVFTSTIFLSQPIGDSRVRVFAGLEGGYASMTGTLELTANDPLASFVGAGEEFQGGDPTGGLGWRDNYPDAKVTAEITGDGHRAITKIVFETKVPTPTLNIHAGFGINMNKFNLDLSVIINPISAGFGVTLGFRYQQ